MFPGIALALAIAFQPLKSQIQRYMNRYVYRESYDYQRIVRDVTKSLSTILDLQSLLQQPDRNHREHA